MKFLEKFPVFSPCHVLTPEGSPRYPFCYVAVVLPLSIGRWIGFGHNDTQTVPSAVTLTVVSIYGLSGLINVTLLIWTRPRLLLLRDAPDAHSFDNTLSFSADNSHDTRQSIISGVCAKQPTLP